jgi:hypothetical protein
MAEQFINIDYLAEAVAAKVRTIHSKRLMDLKEAAEYLGMTTNALRFKVRTGQIPIVKLDARMRFDRITLDKLIKDHEFQEQAAHASR